MAKGRSKEELQKVLDARVRKRNREARTQGADERFPLNKGKPVRTKPKAARAVGRPSDYSEEILHEVVEMIDAGFTDYEIATMLKVDRATLYRWKLAHPEFRNAATRAKQSQNERVEASLYERATGYYHESEKIFVHEGAVIRVPTIEHTPPDPKAATMWLTNRSPDRWKNHQDVNLTGSVEVKGSERDVALAMIQLLREAADDESEPEPTLIEHDPVERPTVVQSERSRRFG